MNRQQLLKRLDGAWTALKDSYAGMPNEQLVAPGAAGVWSVKDVLAHVTTWEQEALKYLPLILQGGHPPRYSQAYGGIDAFNGQMMENKRGLTLAGALDQLEATHRQLVDYLQIVPEELFARETRFRRRLRLDTYSHYAEHTRMIQEWRARTGW